MLPAFCYGLLVGCALSIGIALLCIETSDWLATRRHRRRMALPVAKLHGASVVAALRAKRARSIRAIDLGRIVESDEVRR